MPKVCAFGSFVGMPKINAPVSSVPSGGRIFRRSTNMGENVRSSLPKSDWLPKMLSKSMARLPLTGPFGRNGKRIITHKTQENRAEIIGKNRGWEAFCLGHQRMQPHFLAIRQKRGRRHSHCFCLPMAFPVACPLGQQQNSFSAEGGGGLQRTPCFVRNSPSLPILYSVHL